MAGCTGIIWNGRGGQGAFTASKILGAAYVLGSENGNALAFPSFGPERRGAPVRAFTKLSLDKVADRSEISKPDYTVYLDSGLYVHPEFGTAIVNTRESLGDDIITVDGSGLAKSITGMSVANTAMVGALAAVWGGISLESIFIGIDAVMPEKIREKNKKVVERAFDLTRAVL